MPYLNGGLFQRSDLDQRVADLPDDLFADILGAEDATGLLYRYSFTVEESKPAVVNRRTAKSNAKGSGPCFRAGISREVHPLLPKNGSDPRLCSSPADIKAAIDPEMLGKVFEELVTGRHETGSYYTPRVVVSFMCREAIKAYLSGRRFPSPSGRNAGGGEDQTVAASECSVLSTQYSGGAVGEGILLPSPSGRGAVGEGTLLPSPSGRRAVGEGILLPSPSGRGAAGEGILLPSPSGRGAGGEGNPAIAALVDRQDVSGLNSAQAQRILAALEGLKALDPACGSGAYLVGLLQELVLIAIRIMGDVAIFVNMDSADVWVHPEIFELDQDLQADPHCRRAARLLFAHGPALGQSAVSLGRAAPSRASPGGSSASAAPASFTTSCGSTISAALKPTGRFPPTKRPRSNGEWVKAPGLELFRAMEAALGPLPLVAEDLGLITPEVDALRLELGMPGMKVLQFGFSDKGAHMHLPQQFTPETVAYTGTHDNDTTQGWWNAANEKERAAVEAGGAGERRPGVAVDARGEGSVAEIAIAPAQDLLELGSEARMNTPAVARGIGAGARRKVAGRRSWPSGWRRWPK